MDWNHEIEQAIPVDELRNAMTGNWHEDTRYADLRGLVKQADIILGIDPSKKTSSIFFGKDMLQRCVDRAPFFNPECGVLRFKVNMSESCDDMEFLCAALKVLKGSHCYGK